MVIPDINMDGLILSRFDEAVFIEDPAGVEALWLEPDSPGQAHDWALVLRKAARHLEAIGRGLD